MVSYRIPQLVASVSFASRKRSFLRFCAAGSRRRKWPWSRATFAGGRAGGIWVLVASHTSAAAAASAFRSCQTRRTASSQWSNQSNPSDKQLGRLTFFSLAKLVVVSAPGSLFLKSQSVCHMALENSITTKNGDNHVALCGLAASLKIFT